MSQKMHPTRIEASVLSSNAALGKAIGALRYDQQQFIFCALSDELKRQASGDRKRGRVKLVTLLLTAELQAAALARTYEQIFELCAPHMKEELSVTPRARG